jgi:ABC-type sugar transport system ATPase subunit
VVAASKSLTTPTTEREQASPPPPALEMRGITKRFPGTVALDGVNLTVKRGEIHGLLGQNGAGKSTLMRILSGDYAATAGSIRIDGELVDIGDPRNALRLGIGIVYQELSLLPNLSVADNLLLGHEPRRGLVIDERTIRRTAQDALEALGIAHIDLDQKVGELPVAEQQLVEIAKVLSLKARVLIFDEPTAALNHEDADRLFAAMRRLRADGASIVFISHRYPEVLEICDRCTVLRNGRVAGVVDREHATVERLIEYTVGRTLEHDLTEARQHSPAADADVLLRVRELSVPGRVSGASFKVKAGQIVGLCGLLGSGQNELARALVGDLRSSEGEIELHGRRVHVTSPRDALRHGIAFISDTRKEEGIFPDLAVRQNITAASLRALRGWRATPLLSSRRERALAREAARQTDVDPNVLGQPISLLSGGNQQKAIIARWLAHSPDVLVCLEPTRGVDVGARLEIYRQLDALAASGRALVVVSTDVEEVLSLCDVIFTLYHGEITAEIPRERANERAVALAMQGHAWDESAEGARG